MSIPDQSPAREPIFNIPGVILAIFAICAAVFLVENYVLTE
ncbi:TPA: rhomboid family intramembrane serine protease, partial [Escherichia coli]|nr:rhomboid family intramembrane serine protease [Escherichia coli]